jgi:hypothetical protein
VLDGWTASPARFREDSNAEEDFALTGYRDRLVVELAQNAADAAARARVPGRLLLRLEGDVLLAANTGAPLDAAGVEALSTLRASAKRDDDPAATVGRFGVGFAAVLSVTDDPSIVSATGAVSWHRSATVEAVSAVPSLAEELARRDGHVPVLRLPWGRVSRPGDHLEGYDTSVVLPLRDAAAADLVARLLAEVDAAMLLMLPALVEVVVETVGAAPRVLRASDLDVRTAQSSGRIDPDLVVDRPTEERRTSTWSVRWAVPRPPGVAAVVHAPTPTDEPLDLPGLLLASFPLDPTRRRVAAGPLRDFLVERAAEAYVSLVREVAAAAGAEPESVLGLVPSPVAAGPLDAEVRQGVLARLGTAPILPGGLRPDQAVAVDGLSDPAHAVLAEVLPGLLAPEWGRRRELDLLGVRRTRLADVVDELAALARPPAWWRELYAALDDEASRSALDREALAGLPVPLADGRLVRGPRTVVVGLDGAEPELTDALLTLGLRVVDPVAAHPLLERLGAAPADPRAVLTDPAVRAAVEYALDTADTADTADTGESVDTAFGPAAVAAAVLGLVRAAAVSADVAARELPWLADLLLPDEDGDWVPAGELLLPGAALAAVLATGALAVLAGDWAQRWGADVLGAVGVLATFAVVRDEDVAVDPDATDHDLDGEDEWLEEILLDLGDLSGSEGLPPTLPTYVAIRDLDLVEPSAWPAALRLMSGDPVLRAAVTEPARVLLADGRTAEVASYAAWWLRRHPVLAGRLPTELRAAGTGAALAGLLDEAPELGLDPGFLRAIGVVTSVAEVADSPMVLPLLRAGVDARDAAPDSSGAVPLDVPAVVARVLPGAAATYLEHDDLRVAGVECDWWVSDGVVHAATLDGLARGLAWAADRWDLRLLLAAVLAEPGRADELLAEDAWG